MKRVRITLLSAAIIFGLALSWAALKFRSPGRSDLQTKVENSRQVPAFRVTPQSYVQFSLLPTDLELQIESNLEIDPNAVRESYDYGIRIEVVRKGETIFEEVYYERTKKTSSPTPNSALPYESAFYISGKKAPADSRSTAVLLQGIDLTGAYMQVSLSSDSDFSSAAVRAARVINRTSLEALRAWKHVGEEERKSILGGVLVAENQSTKDTVIRLMSRGLEWIGPEGKPNRDFFPVELYLAKNSAPAALLPARPNGYLLGPRQAAVFETKSEGYIRINAFAKDGLPVRDGAVEISPALQSNPPQHVLTGFKCVLKNTTAEPLYVGVEISREAAGDDSLWSPVNPAREFSRYYMIGPGLSHPIEADVSEFPERVRIVTRAHYANAYERGSVTYAVRFRALNSNGATVKEGEYKAESEFEPLDSYANEDERAGGEALGNRHVAYLYLPLASRKLVIESDRNILVALSTEYGKTEAKYEFAENEPLFLTEAAHNKPCEICGPICEGRKRSKGLIAHWFYFRPSNLQDLVASQQTRLIDSASPPNRTRPLLIGKIDESRSLPEGLEGESVYPEKTHYVEIFEPKGKTQSSAEWSSNWFAPLNPTEANLILYNQKFDIGGEQAEARLRYKLDEARLVDASPTITAGGEKTVLSGRSGRLAISADLPEKAFMALENAKAGDRVFINRPTASAQENEIWIERAYFNLSSGRPLTVKIERSSQTSGVNIILRFDRSQTAPVRIRARASITTEDGKEAGASLRCNIPNVEDKQAIQSNRPDQALSAPQRIFVPFDRALPPGRYAVKIELMDEAKAYGRFFYYSVPKPEQKDEINLWVESKE